MRSEVLSLKSLLVTTLVVAGSAGMAVAQTDKPTSSAGRFKFKSGKSDVGTLYQFERGTFDGSRTGTALLYVASKSQIQILLTELGSPTALSAQVEMSWDTASPRLTEIFTETKGGPRVRAATSTLTDRSLETKIDDPARANPGPATVSTRVAHLPAHAYTLDFVTLAAVFRYLTEPEKEFDIGVIGELPGATGGPFSYRGKVNVKFVEDVDRDGVICRKFRLGGPGLGDQEGFLWTNKEKGNLQDMEIPASPGRGWANLKLVFKSAENASETVWERRKAQELATAFK